MPRMAHTPRMARWLADFPDPGKYVRYTKMTPVIYFALQTLNNKEFYDANLIFQKRELS